MLKTNKPEILIIGVMKSGTTSIHSYLRQCSEISVSEPKEPHYLTHNPYNLDEKGYLNLFKNKEKLNVESSVSYFQSIPFINFDKDQKIIIAFRDPVERIFSQYKMEVQHLVFKGTFSDYLKTKFYSSEHEKFFYEPLNVGEYAILFGKLLEKHHIENIKIVSFEHFKDHEKETMEDILNFIGISNLNTFNFKQELQNPSFYFDKPYLRTFFEKLRELKIFTQKFLTRDFPGVKFAMKLESFLLNFFNSDIKMSSEERIFLKEYYKDKNKNFKILLDKNGFDSSFVDKWQ